MPSFFNLYGSFLIVGLYDFVIFFVVYIHFIPVEKNILLGLPLYGQENEVSTPLTNQETSFVSNISKQT